jgi:energy-coupling factor transport system ATP-binding protein
LKNINLVIQEGEFVGIIGQNGAGKSTLLKCITGLLKPTRGTVLVDGVDTRQTTVPVLATKVGFVLQNPDRQIFSETVRDEVAFGPRNLRLPEEEVEKRVTEALESVGLSWATREYPLSLSKGDRAKVIVASVLAMRPKIIILDEPTTGQDYKGCYQILQIARDLNKKGHTILMVTHHMHLVTEYCRRTIVFSQGSILLDGGTREVFSQPHILQQTYVAPPQITRVAAAVAQDLRIKGTVLTVDELVEQIKHL